MKHNKNIIMKCQKCNKPFRAYGSTDAPICKSCRRTEEEKKLADAGFAPHKRMVRTEYDCAYNDSSVLVAQTEQRIAEEMHDAEVAMTVKCKDCGEEFTISNGEKEWYEKKGLALPARCRPCRKKRKSEKETRTDQIHEDKK